MPEGVCGLDVDATAEERNGVDGRDAREDLSREEGHVEDEGGVERGPVCSLVGPEKGELLAVLVFFSETPPVRESFPLRSHAVGLGRAMAEESLIL